MNEQSHPWREDLGAYLVGALEADEAERMRRHLDECAACRAEYLELAPAVGLLAKVPVEALTLDGSPAETPDPAMWERLSARAGLAESTPAGPAGPGLGAAGSAGERYPARPGQGPATSRPGNRNSSRRTRRSMRPATAAALSGALVAAAAAGVYAGVNHDGGSGAQPGAETVSAADAATGVSASVQYGPTDWGSWVQITLKGVKPGDDCVLYAMDGAGDKTVASTWWAPTTIGQSATVPGGVAMESSAIRSFQVATSVGNVLLTIPAS